jgi:fatty acid desaturase
VLRRGVVVGSGNRSDSISLWKPGRWTKVLALIIGGLFAVLSFGKPGGYGWFGASLMAIAAIAVPTLQYRVLWNNLQFWVTILLLAIFQIPLVFAVHHFVDQFRRPFLLAFGVVDGLCVIAVIFYACVNSDRSRE